MGTFFLHNNSKILRIHIEMSPRKHTSPKKPSSPHSMVTRSRVQTEELAEIPPTPPTASRGAGTPTGRLRGPPESPAAAELRGQSLSQYCAIVVDDLHETVPRSHRTPTIPKSTSSRQRAHSHSPKHRDVAESLKKANKGKRKPPSRTTSHTGSSANSSTSEVDADGDTAMDDNAPCTPTQRYEVPVPPNAPMGLRAFLLSFSN